MQTTQPRIAEVLFCTTIAGLAESNLQDMQYALSSMTKDISSLYNSTHFLLLSTYPKGLFICLFDLIRLFTVTV